MMNKESDQGDAAPISRRDFLKVLGASICALKFPFQENEEGQGSDSPPCGFPLSSGLEHSRVYGVYHDGGEIKGYDYYPTSGRLDHVFVLSTLDGIVTKIGIDRKDNTFVEISNDGYKVKYLHVVTREWLEVGDKVIPGEDIGKLSTRKCENSTGPHVHYSIFDKEKGKNVEDQDQFFRCGNGKMPSMDRLLK